VTLLFQIDPQGETSGLHLLYPIPVRILYTSIRSPLILLNSSEYQPQNCLISPRTLTPFIPGINLVNLPPNCLQCHHILPQIRRPKLDTILQMWSHQHPVQLQQHFPTVILQPLCNGGQGRSVHAAALFLPILPPPCTRLDKTRQDKTRPYDMDSIRRSLGNKCQHLICLLYDLLHLHTDFLLIHELRHRDPSAPGHIVNLISFLFLLPKWTNSH